MHAAAAWLTVKVNPATVIVPARTTVLRLAAYVKTTLPLPVPLVPAVIVIHETLATAVHAHPVPAATNTVLVPFVAETFIEDGLIEYEHAAPVCSTA
jgi:hypothetical protein